MDKTKCEECNKERTKKEIDCGDLDGLCYVCYSKYEEVDF